MHRLDSDLSESIKSGMTVEQLHELLAKAPEWEMQRLQKMVQLTEHHILGLDRTLDEDYTRVAVNSALEVRPGAGLSDGSMKGSVRCAAPQAMSRFCHHICCARRRES